MARKLSGTLKPKILIGVVCFNEVDKIDFLLEKFKRFKLAVKHQVLFINDASYDGTERQIEKFLQKGHLKGGVMLSNPRNCGVGYGIRRIIHYGLDNKFDIVVIMAGNGKDTPLEIPKLLDPILKQDYDYVQGSRFLQGGSFKNLPLPRKMMILGFTFVMSIFTGFGGTDSTNGFRAYKLSIFGDKRINIDQDWLDRYELETYLHVKVITLGYKIKEVAVSKNYLPSINNYSKMRPLVDWWRLARPIFLLKFGLKS